MGALWGGCDDASGPVLVWVMTNGFRTLRSLPLGGAIPSAVSPEAADTLEHKESVQQTALSVVVVVFTSRDLQTCCHNTASASAPSSIPDHPSPVLSPPPPSWNSIGSSLGLVPRSCSSTFLRC